MAGESGTHHNVIMAGCGSADLTFGARSVQIGGVSVTFPGGAEFPSEYAEEYPDHRWIRPWRNPEDPKK